MTVPPQVGTNVAGPKSGAHFSSFNWENNDDHILEGNAMIIGQKSNESCLLLQALVLSSSDLRHGFPGEVILLYNA